METPGRKFETGDKPLFTEWFDRGGDGIVIRAEAINFTTSTSLEVKIEIYTKKSTDPGDGTLVDSTWVLTLEGAAGVKEKILVSDDAEGNPGMYDLVRYKVSVANGSSGDFIVARVFTPTFFDKSH